MEEVVERVDSGRCRVGEQWIVEIHLERRSQLVFEDAAQLLVDRASGVRLVMDLISDRPAQQQSALGELVELPN